MNILLITGIIVAISITVTVIAIQYGRLKKRESEEVVKRNHVLLEELNTTRDQFDNIIEHNTRVHNIKTELKPLKKQIKEAKTDEEALSVLNSIIDHNNKLSDF